MSELRIPPQHLQTILDAIPDGIGVEHDGVIVWANVGFARLYGYGTVEEVTGRSMTDFVAPSDRDRLARYTTLRGTDGNVPNHYYFRGVRRDGSTVEVEIFVTAFESEGQRYVLGALRDQTERMMMARRMELSQRLESLGTLARSISHDFNNLLGSILGNTDLAEIALDQGRDPQLHLERIRKAAEKGSQLTRQLQTFTGNRSWEGHSAAPSSILQDTEEILAHSARNVRIQVDAPSDLPSVAMAPGQLQQILMNLATNALDAMPDGGVLTLRCGVEHLDVTQVRGEAPRAHPASPGEPQAWLRFVVEDTGLGIRPSDLPRIFEPFFTTKGADRGTGLGLAVVFGSVRSHGGWIDVDSEVGRGARFTFHLPMLVAPEEEEREEVTPPELHPAKGEAVLVVDDDPGMRTFIQEALESEGYRVTAVDNGLRALDLVASGSVRPQVAVVDLVMPGMNGVEVSLGLQSVQPGLRILMCTGLAQDDRIAALPEATRATVMRKPVSAGRLLQTVRKVLDAK